MPAAGAEARARLTREVLERIVGLVPGEWLVREGEEATPDERRAAYLRCFTERLRHAVVFEEEIGRARA